MKKVSCAQQQQILHSIINAATLLVLTIIHVLIMFAFCRGGENENQVSVSFSNCVNKDQKKNYTSYLYLATVCGEPHFSSTYILEYTFTYTQYTIHIFGIFLLESIPLLVLTLQT